LRVGIHAVGRLKQGPERDLCARYVERAKLTGKAIGLTGFDITEHAESRASSAEARKADEARMFRASLPEGVIVVLDERGGALSSEQFARQMARWRDDSRPAVSFVIGGADGLDPGLVDAADLTVSFSPLTWPHQLVRIMLAEQLYRSITILTGHPYHRE
jgi:23S rRNA (pseudouridine1915-N3)-methyltransferase